MLTTLPRPRTTASAQPDFATVSREDERVYAIAFDMDTDTLQKSYPGASWTNAYTEIKKVLDRHGFTRQQGERLLRRADRQRGDLCPRLVRPRQVATVVRDFCPGHPHAADRRNERPLAGGAASRGIG